MAIVAPKPTAVKRTGVFPTDFLLFSPESAAHQSPGGTAPRIYIYIADSEQHEKWTVDAGL